MADVEMPLETEKKAEEEIPATKETPAEKTETPKKGVEESTTKEPAAAESPKKNGTETPAAGGEPTKLETDIIRQIEYYFGDANLSRDKFLLEQISSNEGAWVPLKVLLTFKRLNSLTEDPAVIVAAVNKSNEGLVEVHEDKEKLRRHPERPIPEQNEEKRLEVQSRTAYVKGFPPTGTEMSDLLEFFNPHVKVVHILMRKYHEKATKKYLFKGSVFVTFSKKEECTAFIEKEKVEYNGNELIRKWKEEYLDQKKEERTKDDAKRLKNNNKNKKEEEEKEFILPIGAVLYLKGFPKEGITREDIKETIHALGSAEIAFVEFSKGDENAHVRFTEENAAKTVFEKLKEGKLSVKDNEVTATILEGDEEKEFLAKAIENMKSRRNNSNRNNRRSGRDGGGHHGGSNRHGGNRHGGGGHGRNDRKRRNDNSRDEPPAKK